MDENGKVPPERTEETAAHADQRPIHRRKRPVLVAVALVAIVVFLGMIPLEVCRDCAFVCENTGSHMGYRQWCIGLRSGPWRHESRLEQFVRRRHPSDLAYRWTSYAGTGRNIFGRSCSFQHERPHVGTIIMTRAWFDEYVDTLDDTAKLDLYRLLVTGDRGAIQAEEKKIEMAREHAWALK